MSMHVIFAAALCSAMLVGCNQNQQQDEDIMTDQDTVAATVGQRLDRAIEDVEQSAERTSTLAKGEVEKAEAALQQAKRDLEDAKDRGDAKAEVEAQKALDKATEVWDRTRNAADKAVDATKDAARKTGQAVDTTVERASRKVKDVLQKD